MSGGFYCSDCGALESRLPSGLVTCRRCGASGLRGYDRRPKRVICPYGCAWRGWDDGGVNDDLGAHLRRAHREPDQP